MQTQPPSAEPTATPTPATTPLPVAPAAQPKPRNWLALILGGCGCAALVCVALVGGALLAANTGLMQLSLLSTSTPTPTATLIATPTPTTTPTVPPVPTRLAATNTPLARLPINTPTTAARLAATNTPLARLPLSTPTTGARGSTPVPVGGAGFGAIRFAPAVLTDDTALDPLDRFPADMTIIYAVFPYQGLRDGQTWRTEWLRDGKAQPNISKEQPWKGGASGSWWISIFNKDGLSDGEWQLNLYLDNKLQRTARFTLDAASAGQPNFTPLVFASDKDASDRPVDPVPADKPSFSSGVKNVYAFFNGVNMAKGTVFTTQWFRNGKASTDPHDFTWSGTPDEDYWVRFFNTDGTDLSDGAYEFKLMIGGQLVKLGVFYIAP